MTINKRQMIRLYFFLFAQFHLMESSRESLANRPLIDQLSCNLSYDWK